MVARLRRALVALRSQLNLGVRHTHATCAGATSRMDHFLISSLPPVPLRSRLAPLVLALLLPLPTHGRADAQEPARPASAAPSPALTQPQLVRGAKVRVLMVDRAALPWGTGYDGSAMQAEARLLGFDGPAVVVRLRNGAQYTLPPGTVRRLEVRTGAGACRASAAGRVACVGAGLLGGWLVGRMVGSAVANKVPLSADGTVSDAAVAASERRWARGGMAAGLALGAGGALALGRDHWEPVAGWPSAGR